MCRVHATVITFFLPENTDWKAVRAAAPERAEEIYKEMPGLSTKVFVLNEEASEYGGLYLWETRAHLDAFLASDTFRDVVAKFGQPRIRTYEVAALLEDGKVVVPALA
jgi:heme-degrading monooxygenase HmoA